MKIYFARHAESQANRLHIISNRQLPHELTDEGRAQARRLAERLRAYAVERIYSSPVLRAVQTATILAEALGVPFEQEDGLREFDCGVAEGRADAAAWQLWRAEYEAWVLEHNYAYQIEAGESFYQVSRRFGDFIQQLIEKYGTTPAGVVCVSHGGIYSVMLPQLMTNVTPAMITLYGFEYTGVVVAELRAGGLTCIEWNGEAIE